MVRTELLSAEYHAEYKEWLLSQDKETLDLYFGVGSGPGLIDSLIAIIQCAPENHRFLVAKRGNKWIGTIHMAVSFPTVEFGVIVKQSERGQGVANQLMNEAFIWSCNRGYYDLYMHCLTQNAAIRHLCNKNKLKSKSMFGETEAELKIPPPNIMTIIEEDQIRRRNFFMSFINWI